MLWCSTFSYFAVCCICKSTCKLALLTLLRAQGKGVSCLTWTHLKLVPPKQIFWNIWTHSEKFVLTVGQPHERKSVTTKDISGVHSCVSREMNDCYSWVCLSGPMQSLKHAFVAKFEQCTQKLSIVCGWEWDCSTLCAAELMGQSCFQKPQKPHNPPYIRYWSKVCKRNVFQVYIHL